MMEQLVGMLSNAPGGSGTNDYEQLSNKPSVNGVVLSGEKSAEELGLVSGDELEKTVKEIEKKIPAKTSELENDSDFQTGEQVQQAIGDVEKKIPDVTDLEKSVEDLGKHVEELQRTVDSFVDGNEVAF